MSWENHCAALGTYPKRIENVEWLTHHSVRSARYACATGMSYNDAFQKCYNITLLEINDAINSFNERWGL